MPTPRKKTPPAAPTADSAAGLLRPRRATLRMTDADFDRFRWEILPAEKLSWQDLLTEAVDEWLTRKGHSKLEVKE